MYNLHNTPIFRKTQFVCLTIVSHMRQWKLGIKQWKTHTRMQLSVPQLLTKLLNFVKNNFIIFLLLIIEKYVSILM